GVFPMSVTLAREETFNAFLSEDRTRAFFHGHTFTAHPVGCAVALASLELTLGNDAPAQLDGIGNRIAHRLCERIGTIDHVKNMRRTGGIVAFDLELEEGSAGYFAQVAPELRARAIELGVLIRPLGNVVYALPPACVTDEEADRIADVMATLAEEAPQFAAKGSRG
ncbi:MAG: aminotransferase class III-fold pyridoxal phosphate-dependent enzyme, partial [Planctomycetota bacterium]